MGRRRSNRAEEEEENAAPRPPPQLPWGMEKTEMQPSSLTALTDDKLARFVLGHQKKTKFQKDREDREAKKRQADEEAAKIYATFVASFDNEDETKGKAFVRGGATQGSCQSSRQSGDVYRLKAKEPAIGAAAAGKKVSEMDKMLQEIKQKDAEYREQGQTVQRPKKRRAIDEFMEEMKERGPAPVSMDGVGTDKGSFDTGDPETTNLYVGNLAPTVTEEALQAEFGRFGDVYSVKIMWPRSEEERARRRNCGFVSFYERRDADDARINMSNKELEGQPMIVGWSKAVKIQPRACTPGLLLPSAVTPPAVAATPVVSTVTSDLSGKQTVTIEIPADEKVRRRVDRLAHYVAADGLQFENAVRMREANTAEYGFLFEPQSPIALYYRWRVYSFAMGDDEYSWRETSFQMTADEAAVDLVGIILGSFKSSTSSDVALVGLLYVTSDILHNSSAAVKNASLFRTTFQECLPEIMDTLRVAHKNIGGRMSANAMKEKVMNVLTAWESWSLFPPAVLVGLHATFLRKVEEDEYVAARSLTFEGIAETDLERLRKTCRQSGIMATGDAKQLVARLQWLKEFTSPTAAKEQAVRVKTPNAQPNNKTVTSGEPKSDANGSTATRPKQVDKDDENDLDGDPIDEEDLDGDPIDGKPIDDGGNDVDGEPMDEEALDGVPLDDDVAGDELDGKPLDDDDLDGAPMDDGDLDGEPI
ncbi:hypothetical protein PRNP1_010510 [Phytophthora ramorum]